MYVCMYVYIYIYIYIYVCNYIRWEKASPSSVSAAFCWLGPSVLGGIPNNINIIINIISTNHIHHSNC